MKNVLRKYFQAVQEAYQNGNIETSYNRPIMELLESFGAQPRDLSGGRSGKRGENIDIKLWRTGEVITETEPFSGVEVKKIGGVPSSPRQKQDEAAIFGHIIFTDNLRWEFWRAGEEKMYTGL